MGSKVSKEVEEKELAVERISRTNSHDTSNKICVNCQKDQQVDLPNSGTVGSSDIVRVTKKDNPNSIVVENTKPDPCGKPYATVDQCMQQNHGQISACAPEWKMFQECFQQHKPQRIPTSNIS
jgi:hypothetical protein